MPSTHPPIAPSTRLRPLRVVLLAICAWATSCGPGGEGSSAERDPAPPGLTVVSDSDEHFPHYHEFGKVRYGSRVEHTFLIRSGEDSDVRVETIQTACQCTQVAGLLARGPDGREVQGDASRSGNLVTIPARGELELTLAVETGTLPPNHEKLAVVRVRTDSSTTPFLTFEMHVLPQKLFSLNPPEVRLDEVPIDNGQTVAIRILRGDPTYVADIVGVKTLGEGLEATIEKEFHFEDPIWTVLLTVPPGEELGPFRNRLVLNTTDDEGNTDEAALRELPIPVRGHYVENIRLTPLTFTFGKIPAGEEGVIDAYLRALVPGARVKVLDATVEGPAKDHVRVECVPRAEDGQGRSPVWEVLLYASADLQPGPFEATVKLELDDSQTPTLTRPVRGEVLPRE